MYLLNVNQQLILYSYYFNLMFYVMILGKYKKLKAEAKLSDEEPAVTLEQNHRDAEQGR